MRTLSLVAVLVSLLAPPASAGTPFRGKPHFIHISTADVRSGLPSNYKKKIMPKTVEVYFDATQGQWGHLGLRIGDKYYDMTGTRGSAVGSFADLVWNRQHASPVPGSTQEGMVGFVFQVKNPAAIADAQKVMENLVASINQHNLPVFHPMGKPTQMEPDPSQGGFKLINSKRTGLAAFIDAKRDGAVLRSEKGIRVPVRDIGNGQLQMDSETCASFVFTGLNQVSDLLGLPKFDRRVAARSSADELARSISKQGPRLVVHYSNAVKPPDDLEATVRRVIQLRDPSGH